LLLNSETSATPFLADSSTNNFSLTAFGDTKPSNFNPYTPGYYSVSFDGTSNSGIGRFTGPTIGTGDYTVEFWIYLNAISTDQDFYEIVSGTSINILLELDGASNKIRHNLRNDAGTSNFDFNSTSGVVANTWYHIAFVVSGTTAYTFINGNCTTLGATASLTGSRTATFTDNLFGTLYTGARRLNGYMSNFRLVKGTALYTSNFTPSAAPLTLVSGTALLMCQANRFIDTSTNNYTINPDPANKINSFNPFVPNSSYITRGSTYFDGTGDYLRLPTNTALAMGNGDFTIEAYLNLSTVGIYDGVIIELRSSGSTSTGFVFNCRPVTGGYILNLWTDNSANLGSIVMPYNAWNHVALTRTGSTVRLFSNGLVSATFTKANNFSDTPTPEIGYSSLYTDSSLTGYISDLRIVKGTALYTANFAPPTQPLTAVTNTSLLTLQTNQPHTNSQFLDNSTSALQITRTGNTTQGSFSPYGANWSNYFDGSGDYLSMPSAATTYLAANPFTIEAWVYPTAENGVIIGRRAVVTARGFWLAYGNITSKKFSFYAGDTNNAGWEVTLTSTNAFELNKWHHVAITRNASNVFTLWVNGTSEATVTSSFTIGDDSSTLYVGTVDGGGTPFTGYMSNLRIVQNTALYTTTFTPPTQPLTAITGTGLLTCQSANLVDSSLNAATITKTGDVRVQKFSPFATVTQTPTTHSVYFDGTGDYLTLPASSALNLTGDFTVEFWVNMTSLQPGGDDGWGGPSFVTMTNGNGAATIGADLHISLGRTAQNAVPSVWTFAGVLASTGNLGTVSISSSAVAAVAGKWYHLAMCRTGSTVTAYIDGVSIGTVTSSGAFGSSTRSLFIGATNYTYTRTLNGHISNLRILNGTALYTSNFTPSTAPLTAISGTSLLTCQDATIRDNSSNNFVLTVAGNATPRRYNPFGSTTSSAQDYTPAVFGSSAYFDGIGDYLQIYNANSLVMSTGAFTAEAWVYPLVSDTWQGGISTIGTSGTGFSFNVSNTNKVRFSIGNSGAGTDLDSTASVIKNTWTHIALVRNSSSTMSLFINGVLQGTATSSANITNTECIIGRGYTNLDVNYLNGYISDARVIKGQALYTSNFVPPTQPLQAVPNTTLLLNMDKSAIQDKSGKVVAETVGDAKVSTSVKKYGSSSMYFDGSGDYLTFPSNPQYAFGTGDFTVECWVNSADVSTAQKGFIQTSDAVGGLSTGYATGITFLFGARQNGSGAASLSGAVLANIAGTNIGSSAAVVTANTWTHLALVRASGTVTIYVDGVSVGSGTAAGNCSGTNLVVGGYYSTGYLYNGYIDDLRITRGYARYTANFTPPTSALLTK